MRMSKKNKRYGIGAWVGALYGPIIFGLLIVNLTKVEWKYVFESNKSRVARHHQKANEIGLPGIPYLRNSGIGSILYVNENDVAYGMCGPHFFCSEELNSKEGIHFMPINSGTKRTKRNVIYDGDRFWCDSYEIKGPGKCGSGGWVYGSER